MGDVWYTQNFLYDVVARLAPSINSPRYAHAFARMPLPTSDAWSYFEVELTFEGDFVECVVGAQSAKETRRGVVCGKSRGCFGVATLGGLYSEGAFRRGGIGDRACDRVGVLSRVVGEHRHVIFIARRRGGSSRRAVGACQVSCSQDVFPTVTLRSRGVSVKASTRRSYLEGATSPRKERWPGRGGDGSPTQLLFCVTRCLKKRGVQGGEKGVAPSCRAGPRRRGAFPAPPFYAASSSGLIRHLPA